ncbi:Sigma 54 modulation protein / S30EA ribosomal protein [Gracilaria domingensis]|nr:Sigma 54 modulation protein / S30EA ribosomal protein [Gracilaria domingensis]
MFLFVPTTPLSAHPARSNSLCARSRSAGIPSQAPVRPASIRMVLSDRETKPIRITGNNIHLTQSLQNYVNEKLHKVIRRFGNLISKMDVHLTVEHNPSIPNRHKAEVVAFAGKTILRTETRSHDMYTSIDDVEDRIGRIIRKYKERKEGKTKASKKTREIETQVTSAPELEDDVAEDDGDYQDVYGEAPPPVPAVNEVVRRKVFPMPLQTVEEAVLCCEYVDHPWYLFRNAATSEISLVYKRNRGGYGLIEPSNPNVVDEQPL